MMNGKTLLLILGSLSLFSLIISTPFTNFAFGQASPNIGNNTSSSTSSTSSLDSSNLVNKLERISSLSNILGMSMVDGIKVSGINVGDTDLSVTLKYQPTETNVTNTGNVSLPLTVIVTKLPVSNLTQLLSLVEAARNMATAASSNVNPLDSVLGQPGSSNAVMESNAVQILSLLRNIQIGATNVVNANWTLPQTVSMGLLGGLRSIDTASTAPNDLVLVAVIPFLGQSSIPTMQLK
jgi:flagellar basal body rod protein FlgC